MSLVPPTDHFYLTWGERLRDPRNNRESWPGQTIELADDSMQLIAHLMQTQVLPAYYTRIETAADFLDLVLLKRTDPDHHVHFERGCCLIKLERFEEASHELAAAIKQYLEDGREWCFPKAAQCEQMLKAIAEGTALDLYEQWKAETIQNLKLEKIVSQKN